MRKADKHRIYNQRANHARVNDHLTLSIDNFMWSKKEGCLWRLANDYQEVPGAILTVKGMYQTYRFFFEDYKDHPILQDGWMYRPYELECPIKEIWVLNNKWPESPGYRPR